MVIGVTGGIGSGKTTIVKMFAKFKNVAIYFADKEAKQLMHTSEEIKEKLIEEFSENVYKDGKLNRSFLAEIVFKDKNKLAILNSIVHPVVNRHLQRFITENKHKEYIVYENAILFENGSDIICDKVITVTAPEHIKIERVTSRDQITTDLVKDRIKNQWSDAKKIIQSHYVIENIVLENSEAQVFIIHNKLT